MGKNWECRTESSLMARDLTDTIQHLFQMVSILRQLKSNQVNSS